MKLFEYDTYSRLWLDYYATPYSYQLNIICLFKYEIVHFRGIRM